MTTRSFHLILVALISAAQNFIFFSRTASASCENMLAPMIDVDSRPLTISELHFQTFGDPSHNALVLIHGLDSTWRTFLPIIDHLATKYYVIVYDQRGHGQSHRGGIKFTTSLLADDTRVLLDHLNVAKAHILGHSMGALTAVQFAAQYPRRTRSLIIEDMELHARHDLTPDDYSQMIAEAQELETFPQTYPDRESLVAALRSLYGNEAEALSYRRAEQRTDGKFALLFRPSVSLLYGYQGNAEDLLGAYAQFTGPVLVMQANPQLGTALSRKGLLKMQTVKPNAWYLFFPDAGHTIHRTAKDEFLMYLIYFIDYLSV